MDTTHAPPPGFIPFSRHGAFARRIGPYYVEAGGDPADAGRRYAFRLDRRHGNPNGIVHGGALYSFADQFLGHAIVTRLNRMCATVKLKVEFLAAARPGHLVEGECDIVRTTRTMAFVRARVMSDGNLLMTADGVFKLLAPFDPARMAAMAGAEEAAAAEAAAAVPAADVPAGYKPYQLQGEFADYYGPIHYRRGDDGAFVCGVHAHSGFDNTNGVVHGGALFAFADDMMGRAVSGTAKRYSATISLDAQYLAPGPLDAWLEGRAEITRMARSLAFVRGEVSHEGKPIFHADAIFRLFGSYDETPDREAGKTKVREETA